MLVVLDDFLFFEKYDFWTGHAFFDHFSNIVGLTWGSASQLIYAGMVLFAYFESTKWYIQAFFQFSKNRGLNIGSKWIISFLAIQQLDCFCMVVETGRQTF